MAKKNSNWLADPVIQPFSSILQAMSIKKDDLASYLFNMNFPILDRATKMHLAGDGLEIEDGLESADLDFSSPHKYILFKQRPVLIYIRDQFLSYERYVAKRMNPFHICFCSALNDAKKQNRFKSRYVVTYNTSGKFVVNVNIRDKNIFGEIYNEQKERNATYKLAVCQSCLYKLNWKNFRQYCGTEPEWWVGGIWTEKNRIIKGFNIQEFLETVRKDIKSGLETVAEKEKLFGVKGVARKEYTLSPEIKLLLKRRAYNRCQACGRFSSYENLQIHHIDHNEGNNEFSNLKVVCKRCHAEIHRKEGGYIEDT